MSAWFLIPIIFIVSLILTRMLRLYALNHSLIDIPNLRSSHSIPTPRGGGVAIVVSFLMLLPLLSYYGYLPWGQAVGLVGSGGAVALIGFLDDHGHIAARWRLLGHFMAAIWALYWVASLPSLVFFGFELNFGILSYFFGALYVVWMLNLYNFMDGIDGLASVEAITVCLSAAVLYFFGGVEQLIWAPLFLAFAVSGFLYWNFPPAKIFMGDAGSGFLGVILATLSLQAAALSPKFFWVWVILLGVFIVDATFTLIRRLIRGDKVYEAHRSHAYQFASRRIGKHLYVTLGVAAINIIWLLPLAYLVAVEYLDGVLALVIAYSPLILIASKYNAGGVEVNS
ncbi:MraY family glycosyltransferase [Pseudomonas violetae]|uniref:Glycosyltransferase family 4 protein n=1 Tax=Pseudomonas violetae TaxID=2915813 RepID=A0ABT0F6C7_9PSED|nr:glycosyltransferase family 4 protein [Pseudomonas violetae]MCK1793566.1 glycosyltransferase family 4 protein [Pseudomonas violetae]